MDSYVKGTLSQLLNKSLPETGSFLTKSIKPQQFKPKNIEAPENPVQETKNVPKLEKKNRDPTENPRTVFVGNVPLNYTEAQLKKALELTPSAIESIRFRSVPVIPKLAKQRSYGIRSKQFTDDCSTKNAYIVFKLQSDAESLIKKQTVKLEDAKWLRISEKFDQSRTIFVGNLNSSSTEDDLRQICEQNVAKVSNVRIVRDKHTHKSKNFGFVEFKNSHFLRKAVRKLNGIVLHRRPLNITLALIKDEAKKKDHERHKMIAHKIQKRSKLKQIINILSELLSSKDKVERIREKRRKRFANRTEASKKSENKD